MKLNILVTICLIISFKVSAQNEVVLPTDSITGIVTFIDIGHVDSLSKDELYSRALSWLGNNYNSAKTIIQTEDKIGGLIIAKPLFKMYSVGMFGEEFYNGNVVKYTIAIHVKDSKYKLVISNFILETQTLTATVPAKGNTENFTFSLKYWDKVRLECIKNSEAIIKSLKADMVKVKDEW